MTDPLYLDFETNFDTVTAPRILESFDRINRGLASLGQGGESGNFFTQLAAQERRLTTDWLADIRRIQREYADLARAGNTGGVPPLARQLQDALRRFRAEYEQTVSGLSARTGVRIDTAEMRRELTGAFAGIETQLRNSMRALMGDLARVGPGPASAPPTVTRVDAREIAQRRVDELAARDRDPNDPLRRINARTSYDPSNGQFFNNDSGRQVTSTAGVVRANEELAAAVRGAENQARAYEASLQRAARDQQRAADAAARAVAAQAQAAADAAAATRLEARRSLLERRIQSGEATAVNQSVARDNGFVFDRRTGRAISDENGGPLANATANQLALIGQANAARDREARAATRSAEVEERRTQRLQERLQREGERTAFAESQRGVGNNFLAGLTSSGFGGGTGGFNGSLDGLAKSAGQTVKFSALYDVMNLLQGALGQAGQEILDFEDSLTNLNVTMGEGKEATQEFLGGLQQFSTVAGANVGQTMDIAAGGMRAFSDTAKAGREEMEATGTAFAREASRMAVIAGTDIKDAAGNVTAIGTAFEIPVAALSRINDAVALAKKLGGGDSKQTSQALASFGAAAQEAGFSLEAAAALAGKIQAATDQSGSAVGNKLSRIVSTTGGSAGQSALAGLNAGLATEDQININAKAADQLTQLSGVWDKLTEAQKKQLVNTIAGTSSTREFVIAMRTLSEQSANGFDAAGKGAAEYEARLHDLSVVIRTIQGELKALVTNVGESGALEPLKAAIGLLAAALGPINAVLRVFNELSPAVRDVAFATAEFAAAMLVVNKVSQAGGLKALFADAEAVVSPQNALARQQLAGAGGSVGATVLRNAAGQVDTVAAEARLEAARRQLAAAISGTAISVERATAEHRLASQAYREAMTVAAAELAAAGTTAAGRVATGGAVAGAGATAATGGIRGVAAGIGGGIAATASRTLSLLGGPVTIAIGSLLALGALKSRADQLNAAMAEGTAGLKLLPDAVNPDDFKNVAAATATAAQDARRASGGPAGFILSGLANNEAKRLDSISSFSTEAAKAIESERRLADAHGGLIRFGDPATRTVESLNAELDTMKATGASAAESFAAVNEALSQVAKTGTTIPVRKAEITAGLTGSLIGAEEGRRGAGGLFGRGVTTAEGAFQGGRFIPNAGSNLISGNSKELSDAIAKALPSSVSSADGTLSAEQRKQVNDAALAVLLPKWEARLQQLGPDAAQGGGRDELTRVLTQRINEYLSGRNVTPALPSTGTLGSDQVVGQVFEVLKPQLDAALAILAPGDIDGQLSALRTQITTIDGLISRTTGGPDEIQSVVVERDRLQREVARAVIADNEKLRQNAQKGAGSKAEIKAIGERFLKADAYQAILAKDTDALIKILDNANTDELNIVRTALLEAQRTAEAAVAGANAVAEAAANMTISVSRGGGEDSRDRRAASQIIDAQQRARDSVDKELQKIYDTALKRNKADTKGGGVYATGSDVIKDKSGSKDKETAAQIAAARAAANSVKIGGELAQTSAAIRTATADVAAAEKGTTAYYNALGQLYAAQQSQRDAILEYRKVQYQLARDNTDPVAQAIIETKIAEAKLLSDTKLKKAPDVLTGDRLALKNAKQSQEAAAFTQRIGDIQTLDGLGKLNAETYIAYLQRERDRLGAIKTKSRQQIDQLNQVDSALQAAFNKMDSILSTRYGLINDTTDPAVNAAISVELAKAKLARDQKQGLSSDVLDADRLSLKQAQAGQEAAAFSQRLSDVQTAEQLGRISHQAYLDYLQSEHDRLSLIGNKTRQQMDQLNQVDLALKGASEQLSGQFNIGDIRIPTPYEVRRYIATQSAGVSYQGAAGNTTNIYIDGTDIGMVQKTIYSAVGSPATTRMVSTARKVGAA